MLTRGSRVSTSLDTLIRWQRKLEVSKDRETSEVIGGLVYRFRLKRKIYKC